MARRPDTKPNITRLNLRQSQTHRGLNLEYQTDGQMTTKPNTIRRQIYTSVVNIHSILTLTLLFNDDIRIQLFNKLRLHSDL